MVGLSIVTLGSTFVLAQLLPNVVGAKGFLLVSAAVIIAMAIAGLWAETIEFRWRLIFTAKTIFLAGSITFLAGGIISSVHFRTYLNYSERDLALTAAYFVIGTACFLMGYRIARDKPPADSGPSAKPVKRLSSVQLWLGALSLLAFGFYGVYKSNEYYGAASEGSMNLWGHCVGLLLPATVLLAMILVRKNATFPGRVAALLLLCPNAYYFSTTWSRRPLEALLLAGAVLYCLNKRPGRAAQMALCLGGLILVVPIGLAQGEYRGALGDEVLPAAHLVAYVAEAAHHATSQPQLDTFLEATETTRLYPSKIPYLYGESFFALLVNPIPRSLWPEKPVGFGYTLAQEIFQTSAPSTNLGPSLEGELYANGGLLAVVLGMLAVGFASKKYDALLLGRARTEGTLLVYSLGLYQFFFLVRGDFLDAGYAFLASVVPVFLLVHFTNPAMGCEQDPSSRPRLVSNA